MYNGCISIYIVKQWLELEPTLNSHGIVMEKCSQICACFVCKNIHYIISKT